MQEQRSATAAAPVHHDAEGEGPRVVELTLNGRVVEVDECDICHMGFEPGERVVDDGGEVAHASCVTGWFRRNFGREGLS